MGKNSALLMFSPDKLIGKLISNIAPSMREKYWQLKGINMFGGEKKKSLLYVCKEKQGKCSSSFSGPVAGRDCQVTDLGMYIP